MKKHPFYAALVAIVLPLFLSAQTYPSNSHERIKILLETLQEYVISETSEPEMLEIFSHLEPHEQELILAELEEPTRQKLKNKIFNCLQVKKQLTANNLQVCNDTILNNLTVNGTFNGTCGNASPTVICGVPACTIAGLILSATSADIPHTLVLRDATGSFAATTITLTGFLELEAPNSNTVSVAANPATTTYTMLLPTTFGTSSSVLTADGNNPSQLSWQTLTAVVTSTLNLFGDVIGSASATVVNTICGFNACNLVTTITTATSADIPLTLVLRDATGSFAATTVTLTGCLILQDSTGAAGGKMCATPNALIVAPLGARALQATASGNTRGTNAVDLQINNGGTTTVASGNFSVITGGASNTAQGQYDVVTGGQDNTISIVSPSIDPQAGYNMISSGSNNIIMINDITNNNNISGYNSIGGAANSITISTTAATASGITVGFNSIASGNQNSINVLLPAGNFTSNTDQGNNVIGGGLQNQITVSPQPTSAGQNVIAGGFSNIITSTNSGIGVGSCIGGGSTNTIYSSPGVIGGGYLNTILPGGSFGTIGGGQYNQAGSNAFIGGGQGNVASGIFSVVAGGNSNSATGSSAAVLGGAGNLASGNYSVASGALCTATGNYSFALGSNCTTTYNNTFVWGDGSTLFTATASNTFSVLAANGARFITSLSNLTQGVQLLPGSGAWVSACDKTKKANYQKVDGLAVLEKVAALPIETWNYTTQDATIRHMGPYAQDFHAAFGLGEDPLGINTIDADGVALAAIQGLYTLHQTQLQTNTQLMQQITALQQKVAELKVKIYQTI